MILVVGRKTKELVELLKEQGYECSSSFILDYPPEKPPALILIDQADYSRREIERWLKESKEKGIPTLMLIATDEDIELALHADDFISLPYREKELLMRVRRLVEPSEEDTAIKRGPLVIIPQRYEVILKGKAVDLTFKEFQLLRFLALHPGRVFSRQVLLDKVWGYDFFGGERTVDVHIRRLRGKLKDPDYLETVRGVGYRFRLK